MNEMMLPTNKKENTGGALVEVESNRAIQEVQAALAIAKRFPRDQMESYTRIMKACERPTLAEKAQYAYPRGDQIITGPTIRLAEVLAQNWGNIQFGIRELSQENGCSEVEAFAWDVETNTRQVKVFTVKHTRYTKKYGATPLKDPRDIYEMVANQGARRLRSCILGVIPGDIIDSATEACQITLEKGAGRSMEDRVRAMVTAFEKIGVTTEMIEARLQHKLTAIAMNQLIDLGKIYNSVKDGMSKRRDWFEMPKTTEASGPSNDLSEAIKQKEQKPPVVEEKLVEKVKNGTEIDKNQTSSVWLHESYKKMRAGKFDILDTADKWTGFARYIFDNRMSWPGISEAFKDSVKKKWDVIYKGLPFILDDTGNLIAINTEVKEQTVSENMVDGIQTTNPPDMEGTVSIEDVIKIRKTVAEGKYKFPDIFDQTTTNLVAQMVIRGGEIASMTYNECDDVLNEMNRLIDLL